jgi:hypothetical protein
VLAAAVFMNVEPSAAFAGMFITKVKVALVLAAKDASVHVMVPTDPTGGSVQVNAGPLFWVSDTKLIPVGTSSVSDTFEAFSVPRFVTTTVNETLLPGRADAGPLLVTRRSAPAPPGVGCVNSKWTASETRGTNMRTRAVPRIAASRRILTDIDDNPSSCLLIY